MSFFFGAQLEVSTIGFAKTPLTQVPFEDLSYTSEGSFQCPIFSKIGTNWIGKLSSCNSGGSETKKMGAAPQWWASSWNHLGRGTARHAPENPSGKKFDTQKQFEEFDTQKQQPKTPFFQ